MDELNSRARSLLDVACSADDPTAEDSHRVRHAVLLRVGAIGVGTAALVTTTAQAKGVLGAYAAKVGAALVVVAGGTAGVAYYSTQAAEPAPVVAQPTVAAPRVTATPAKPVVRAEAAAAVSVDELPVEEAPKRAGVARAARPAEVTPQQHLDAEMQLIRAADAALRGGRTSEALSLLAQHAERHPRGLLRQEREGLNLLARCQSGARGSAVTAAERYVSSAPRSPLAARLRSACGIERE